MTIIAGSKGFSQNDYRSQREHLLKIQCKPFTGCLFYKGNLPFSGDLVKDIKEARKARGIQDLSLTNREAGKKEMTVCVTLSLSIWVKEGRTFRS